LRPLSAVVHSYRAAEYFSPFGGDRHVELGLTSRAAFLAAADVGGIAVEELWLPWRSQRLPSYWLVPAGSQGPGPTLVATSGFDGTLEETYFQIGRAALQRGWRVLQICGPGQMDTARTEPGMYFVPDNESWVSRWVDLALERPEVDAECLALLGISSVANSCRAPRRTNPGREPWSPTHPSSTCANSPSTPRRSAARPWLWWAQARAASHSGSSRCSVIGWTVR
jgi:hypothetical protein